MNTFTSIITGVALGGYLFSAWLIITFGQIFRDNQPIAQWKVILFAFSWPLVWLFFLGWGVFDWLRSVVLRRS